MPSRSSSQPLRPQLVPAGKPRPRVIRPQSPASPEREDIGSHAGRELWLALHLPRFMLDALGGSIAGLRAAPIAATPPSPARTEEALVQSEGRAVVDLERGGRVVCDCDEVAAAAGIAPGMALNSALALSPQLRTLARDPRREDELLDALAEWALRFTPRVSLEPPDGVLLEVRGSLRLFGGVRRLCAQVRERLQSMGVESRLALAPTPLASLWFARTGEEVALRRPDELASRLAPLPLVCTRWPERSLQLLATMGVRTVGDCLKLPREGFARRFEPRMLRALDRAVGRVSDPRAAFVSRERFTARRDLEPEIEDIERLHHAIEPLLAELCAFLGQRARGVEAIGFRLAHRTAPETRVRLQFAQPVAQAGRISGLLHERLARLELPEPVRTVRLRSGPLVEVREEAADLFALDRRRAAGVPQLIERLRARLGTEAVQGVCLVAEHRPESAWRVAEPGRCQWSDPSDPTSNPTDPTTGTSARPLWLLTEPQPLAGDEQPRYEGALDLEAGPERIESGWWDGHDVKRDYYVARTAAGMRLWVFRERVAMGRWFLHGVFG